MVQIFWYRQAVGSTVSTRLTPTLVAPAERSLSDRAALVDPAAGFVVVLVATQTEEVAAQEIILARAEMAATAILIVPAKMVKEVVWRWRCLL